MKEKNLTKEHLIIKVAKLEKEIEDRNDNGTALRKEFARAFGWNKPKKQYDYGDAELYNPTWTEIFVELGKLLNARNFMDFEGNLSELEVKVEQLEMNFKKLEKPIINH